MTRDEIIEIMARWEHSNWATTGGDPTWQDLGPEGQEDFMQEERGRLDALEAKGLVVVPKEPAEAMLDAGTDYLLAAGCNPSNPEDAHECYKAMIEAAE